MEWSTLRPLQEGPPATDAEIAAIVANPLLFPPPASEEALLNALHAFGYVVFCTNEISPYQPCPSRCLGCPQCHLWLVCGFSLKAAESTEAKKLNLPFRVACNPECYKQTSGVRQTESGYIFWHLPAKTPNQMPKFPLTEGLKRRCGYLPTRPDIIVHEFVFKDASRVAAAGKREAKKRELSSPSGSQPNSPTFASKRARTVDETPLPVPLLAPDLPVLLGMPQRELSHPQQEQNQPAYPPSAGFSELFSSNLSSAKLEGASPAPSSSAERESEENSPLTPEEELFAFLDSLSN